MVGISNFTLNENTSAAAAVGSVTNTFLALAIVYILRHHRANMSFARIVPHLPVTSIEVSRETFDKLGFTLDSGSAKHSIMSLSPALSVQLNQSSASAQMPVTLSLEMAGKQGIEALRISLCEKMRGREAVQVGEMQQVGWGKQKFIVTVEDGHQLAFTQEKQVYQG